MQWFLLLGFDDPNFVALDEAADEALDEAHQRYMDVVSDRLLARGPMMTSNHDGHTGSIHILSALNLADAEHFAFNEPYFLAGLYARLEVLEFDSWLGESMWERPGDRFAKRSWLAIWNWKQSVESPQRPDVSEAVLCGGWLRKDQLRQPTGALVSFDATDENVNAIVVSISAQINVLDYELAIIPWRRGGRS
jgi:uncharacterized protein